MTPLNVSTRCAEILRKLIETVGQPLVVGQGSQRHEGQVSQQEIADKLKVSRYSVNSILRGRQTIGPILALKLEREFKISAEDCVIAAALDLLDLERSRQLKADLNSVVD